MSLRADLVLCLALFGCPNRPDGEGRDRDASPDGDADSDWECTDSDGDGFTAEYCGGGDCDDGDATVHPAASDASWLIETVEEAASRVHWPAIAIDAAGAAHVAYFLEDGSDLYYATNTGGTWERTRVDHYNVGEHASIAVDSAGAVHVLYYYRSRDAVRYATNSSGEWQHIDIETHCGLSTSLVLDAEDHLHATYECADGFIHYGTLTGASWTTEQTSRIGSYSPDQGLALGRGSDLAVDAEGVAHIAYHYSSDLQPSQLRYATNAAGSWDTVHVDEGDEATSAGWNPSITIGPAGAPQIAYHAERDSWADEAWFAALDADGHWTVRAISWRGGTVNDSAADSTGAAYICGGGAYELVCTLLGGRMVGSSIVDDDFEDLDGTAMAVDATGALHIAYTVRINVIGFGATDYDLRVATPVVDGIDQDCDGTPDG